MRTRLVLITIALLSLALGADRGAAHSQKQATRPADGAVLNASPEMIGMTFDMPMRVTLLSLSDQDATEHVLTRTDNMQPVSEVTASPPVLPAGRYKVEWRGLAEDGHPMQGTFGFEIRN